MDLDDTLFARWRPDSGNEHMIYLAGVGENLSFGLTVINHPSLPVEVYYLIAPLGEVSNMNDEDFYAQRHNGVLLWSGTLE